MYRLAMDQLAKEDIAAAAAAHQELGPHFDGAVAESLVERIGEEIDKRVDARLGGRTDRRARLAPRPDSPAGPLSWPTTVLALGSMGLGVGATAVVLDPNGFSRGPSGGQIFLALMIWVILGVINVAYARRR
jgi:hypothetical protein